MSYDLFLEPEVHAVRDELPGHQLDGWAEELVWELGNAGMDDPAYYERQLQFSREYLEQFPDSEPGTVVNMLRAQGEALWRLGRRSEAEATYAALVERLPDEGWGYIGWSDQYWLFRPEKTPAEYELGETILNRALARPQLHDRADVLERLGAIPLTKGDCRASPHPQPPLPERERGRRRLPAADSPLPLRERGRG